MRDDLTYRQQRNLNLISEALLTGRTDLLEQVDREASMLDEQVFGGSARPKLTIDTPIGSGPIDVSGAGDVDDNGDTDTVNPREGIQWAIWQNEFGYAVEMAVHSRFLPAAGR